MDPVNNISFIYAPQMEANEIIRNPSLAALFEMVAALLGMNSLPLERIHSYKSSRLRYEKQYLYIRTSLMSVISLRICILCIIGATNKINFV